MMSKTNDSNSQELRQGENASGKSSSGPLSGPLDNQGLRPRNQVFKSGPLFISSKGIGWTSWKKRWFVLTRTSLVFFRSDPSIASQKVGEVNLTLGGIDLNNSASVEVKVDKKLLTVFFPDGRDGRAFTLKAETLEDLQEWKTALENAVQLAPSATHVAGQNGLLKNDLADVANGSSDQQKDKQPIKSMVIGRPILLALEDIDGSPSFLEKALKFIEDHGVKVEGILRQAADVDDVHHRVREYEQGKTEFSPEEDAHVIGDCIKYILRELPSSPVPATCCNALLEAFRTAPGNRLNAMRTAILETFPEPNRRLLQRILLMMQTVTENKAVNRMSTSAVAACMSPLLLRPLLAGDCELENTHMDVAGDGSFQLLQAAAAANHAQAIIITLLDEYDNIFGEGSMSGGLYSDSDESGSASDDGSYDEDDEEYLDDDDDDEEEEDDDNEYASEDHDDEESGDHDDETGDDYEHSGSETCSDSGDHAESDSYDEKPSRSSSFTESPVRANNNNTAKPRLTSSSPLSPMPRNDSKQGVDDAPKRNKDGSVDDIGKIHRQTNVDTNSDSANSTPKLVASAKLFGNSPIRHPRWGRQSAKKNLSMESIDFSLEDEDDEIQRLEAAKIELQNKIAEEANGNAILQASLERRKKALHERRLALEKDVSRLHEQLQKEKDLRAALEAGSNITKVPSSGSLNEKTKIDLREIAIEEENFNNLKQRFDDLEEELNHQHEHNAALLHDREIEIQGTSSQRSMLTSNEGASNHVEKSTKDERNSTMDGDACEWNSESSLCKKNQNQPIDTSRGGSLPKFGWLPNNSSSSDTSATKATPSTSRKSSSKGEGSNTTSALSKLTNRLNFLKERRNQIAFELQFIDKGKGFSTQPALNSPGKGKAPELPTLDKNEVEKSDRISNSRSDANNNSGRGMIMPNEGEKTGSGRKSDAKRNSNVRSSDAPSSGKGMMTNESEQINSNSKLDEGKKSNTRDDATSSNSDKDSNKNKDEKRGSGSKSDATSSNESYYKESDKKSKKKGSSSKSDATSSAKPVEGDSNENNRKTENKGGKKKGFFSSKTDSSPPQNLEQGRKSEYQSSHNLDREKAHSSRSSDKDPQHSSTSRTLSR